MTKPDTATSPEDYISKINEPRRSDVQKLHAFIRKTVPILKPFMIAGMIGYGKYHYRYASGREGNWSVIALASHKNYISLYVCAAKDGKYVAEQYKSQLPKASIGKSCIRFKRLEDIDLEVLKQVIIAGENSPVEAI